MLSREANSIATSVHLSSRQNCDQAARYSCCSLARRLLVWLAIFLRWNCSQNNYVQYTRRVPLYNTHRAPLCCRKVSPIKCRNKDVEKKYTAEHKTCVLLLACSWPSASAAQTRRHLAEHTLPMPKCADDSGWNIHQRASQVLMLQFLPSDMAYSKQS